MQITLNTAEPLSDQDRTLLVAILNNQPAAAATIVTEPAVKPAAPAKAPAKPKPAPAPAPAPVVEEPEEEPEEDLIGGEVTVQDAIDAATALVNNGGQPKVKAALKAIGADRVRNIPADKAAEFVALLED